MLIIVSDYYYVVIIEKNDVAIPKEKNAHEILNYELWLLNLLKISKKMCILKSDLFLYIKNLWN